MKEHQIITEDSFYLGDLNEEEDEDLNEEEDDNLNEEEDDNLNEEDDSMDE